MRSVYKSVKVWNASLFDTLFLIVGKSFAGVHRSFNLCFEKEKVTWWDNKAAELFPKIQPQKMLKQLVIDIIQFTFLTVNSQALWHTNIVIYAIYKLIKNNSLIKYFGCTTALPSQPIRCCIEAQSTDTPIYTYPLSYTDTESLNWVIWEVI